MKWVYNLAVILFSCPSSRANLALIECWLMCCWEQRRRSNGGTSQLHVCLGWFQWCSIHSLVMKITTMETKDRHIPTCALATKNSHGVLSSTYPYYWTCDSSLSSTVPNTFLSHHFYDFHVFVSSECQACKKICCSLMFSNPVLHEACCGLREQCE